MAKQTWKPGNMLYPLPAVMVSVTDGEGNDNIITVAWAGTVCTNPPMVSISVRPTRFSYDMICKTKEFVLNLTTEHLPAAVKRYLAKNKIEFYTCDAIKLARDIGLGERTNMVLQSAFFKLANIIPIGDAVEYMKDAVVKTYGHKGESIVNMNCEAIDAGLNALRKIEIPEEWKTAKDKKAKVQIDTDRPDLAAFVEKVMIPANAMRGDEIYTIFKFCSETYQYENIDD